MRPHLLLLAAAALAVAACAAGPGASSQSGRPSVAPPSTSSDPIPSHRSSPLPSPLTTPPPGRITRIESAELTEGGELLTLHFVGGRPYSPSDPCSHEYTGWAEQVGDVLVAAVVDVTPARPEASGGEPIACDAMGHFRSVSVQLANPFLGSRLEDRAGYIHFLRRPEGLVELGGLPDGWLLRSERSVEESPTGRWERTYSPDASPTDATETIVLYQSFDGPVDVTGGTEQTPVEVNGEAAVLYRYPPNGELVLVWRLGSDGLALVAYEQRIPPDELIALAESATAPGE